MWKVDLNRNFINEHIQNKINYFLKFLMNTAFIILVAIAIKWPEVEDKTVRSVNEFQLKNISMTAINDVYNLEEQKKLPTVPILQYSKE